MKGPQGSLFEPAEYKIDAKKGQTCDDLSFKLKGFSLKFAVKSLNQEGRHVEGPSGLTVELKRTQKAGNQVSVDKQVTDAHGRVEFKDISIPTTYTLSVAPSDEVTFKADQINCQF